MRLESATGGVLQVDTLTTAMPSGTPTVPGRGKETGLAYGAVAGTGGLQTSGVALVHYLEDGSTVAGVQMNIPVPEDGWFYEVWLEAAGQEPFSMGHLTNPSNDVRHNLRRVIEQDLREYLFVRITLEADDGNSSQGKTVASAILKPTTR